MFATEYEPGPPLSDFSISAQSPYGYAIVHGAGASCEAWTYIGQGVVFAAGARDWDSYNDPVDEDGVYKHWRVTDVDSSGQPVNVDLGTQNANVLCQHPEHRTLSTVYYSWSKAGSYLVTCDIDDCPNLANDDPAQVTCRVYVVGGEMVQTSPDPEQYPIPKVYYECAGGPKETIVYTAVPAQQPAGTIFHWTLTDPKIAQFSGYSSGDIRASGLSSVTVKAKNALDADPPVGLEDCVYLSLEHDSPWVMAVPASGSG